MIIPITASITFIMAGLMKTRGLELSFMVDMVSLSSTTAGMLFYALLFDK